MVDGDELPGGAGAEVADPRAPVFALSRDQLAALFTHVDAVVLAFDEVGTVTFVSDTVRELLGHEPGELVGRNAFDFVHPDDAERLAGNLMRWIGRDGIARDDDVRVRDVSGAWRTIAFETVTGARVAPLGAGIATLRPAGAATAVDQELRRRLVSEDRLTKLVRTFMSDTADFDTCVQDALEVLGSLEGVDSVGVWHLEGELLRHRFQWTAPTIDSTIGLYPSFRPEDLAFTRALMRLDEVALRTSDDSPAWRIEKEHLSLHGAKCYLAVPMVADTTFSGFVAFASYRSENIFAPTHRATLRAAAGIFAEAFARHEAQGRLQYQARHDSLTGLANRWAFGAAVEQALHTRALGDTKGVGLLLFDLDRFHVINDSLGHAFGDQLLVSVAGRLSARMGGDEVLARLGGDELVVLLRDVASAEAAVARAEDLLAELEEPFTVGPSALRVTASVGVALATDDEASPRDRSQLLREADAAMYTAKRAGGGRAQLFDAQLRTEVTTRLAREHDLHGVLDRGELCLHYQPEFDLRTGAIVAVEALLRWNHPRDGRLNAGEFVGIAEDSGLIVEIGTWVIGEALRQVREWEGAGVRPVTLRVNLSARQTAQHGLVAGAEGMARATGIDPARVCFELTETAMMLDPDGALDVLEALRNVGFSIAIDDFGTGYSSLAYLREFPVDLVKIDRSFVNGLGATPADTSLVRAIVLMADALGLPVTAEGIETVDQLEALVELGCAHGQGYLLARPAPPEEIASLLGADAPFGVAVTPGS